MYELCVLKKKNFYEKKYILRNEHVYFALTYLEYVFTCLE